MNANERYLIISLICLTVSAIVLSDTLRTGVNNSGVVDEEFSNDDDLPTEILETAVYVKIISPTLKGPEDCETPNGEMGYCIGIKDCPTLLEQIRNSDAVQFLLQSQCNRQKSHLTNPYVCCGKNANFKRPAKKQEANTAQDAAQHKTVLPEECGQQKINIQTRIVGGHQASSGEFPWLARLVHENVRGKRYYGCAGFLIHPIYVLTAGHCTRKKSKVKQLPVVLVVLGELDTKYKTHCVNGICADSLIKRKVTDVIVHPDYDPDNDSSYHNDIALIRLKDTVISSDYVKPICLQRNPDYEPREYIVSGWGRTETEMSSRVKMKVSITPVNRAHCNGYYYYLNINIREMQICAGGEKGRDSCSGDSGGPLMYFDYVNKTWFAAGIVSFGLECGITGWPGVYTNIAHYVPWIEKTIFETLSKS